MPLTREQKERLVESYEESFAAAPHAFLVDYKGVSVPQITELRSRVKESGGEYIVVKNTLVLRAIQDGPVSALKERFTGPTAIAYSTGDPVALAKVLTEFAKDVEAFELKEGLVDGQLVDAAQIKEIAGLPSREELVAKLLYLLQSPVQRLVRVLAAIPRELVIVLDQIAKKKEQQGSA